MRRLFPDPALDADLIDSYGRLPRVGQGRPAVRLNMIASADGAGSLRGRTVGLSGDSDRAVFNTLRLLADVVLVGAGTLRAESYGPVHLDDAARTRRDGWGLPPIPAIAVVSRSCRLDWEAPFFSQAELRPLVLTAESSNATDREMAAVVAEVVVAGTASVDFALALQALADRNFDNVLAEGGPHVSGQLAAAGLLDELCLTLAPLLVASDAGRIFNGPELEPPVSLELKHVLESEGYLFLRYCQPQSTPG